LSSVRSSVTGAAVVPVEVIRQMREVLGIRTVVTGYGMTETTGTISMCRHDDPPEVIAQTVGRPLPGVDVRIADDGEILVRGFNAYPAEIEAVLLGHPAIAQVAVIGAPDDRMGEVGVAFVIPKDSATVDPAEVLAWAWERLAKFKLSRVEVVESLPLNPT